MASSGNFCVFTADLRYESSYSTSDQHSGGGLSIKGPGTGSFEPNEATFTPSSGKWYWEYRAGQGGGSSYGRPAIGVANQAHQKNEDYFGGNTGITGVMFAANDGKKRINGSDSTYGTAVSQNDIVQMALDCDNGAMYFGINNTWQNSGDPTSGTNKTGAALSTGIQNVPINIQHTRYAGGGIDRYNFGQDSTFDGAVTASTNADGNGHGTFAYSPPSGYLALCTANLPLAEAVDSAEDNPPSNYFDVLTYTGDGTTGRAITGLNFQPDWLLIKNRDVADGWLNMNSVTGLGKTHEWNDDGPYEDETDCVTAFNSNGFTIDDDHKVNANTEKYVAYCWKRSADVGFDIVEYTGNSGTNNVSHNLGAEPEAIFMHLKSGTDWDSTLFMNSSVAESMGTGQGIFMTLNNAKQASTYMTSISSSTFTPTSSANQTGRSYVAYVFRGIQGFSNFGQYEGNGDTDGPFIFTGFRPRMFWIKGLDNASNWEVRDTARDINNPLDTTIVWDSNTLEASSAASDAYPVDVLSNGFKIRTTSGNYNTNGNGYIYGAWADVPFKYNNAF